jgi:hypothetical protein
MTLHDELIREILANPITAKDHAAKVEIEKLRAEIEKLTKPKRKSKKEDE